MYVYLGSLAKAAAGSEGRTTREWVPNGIGLLPTVIVTKGLPRRDRVAVGRERPRMIVRIFRE